MATSARPDFAPVPESGRAPAPAGNSVPSDVPNTRATTTRVVKGRGSRSRSSGGERVGSALNSSAAAIAGNGGGFVLAVFLWAWVGLPLIQGGPAQVKNVLRAKFLNKGPDGSWLA